jgi:hypothetical protein
MRFMNNMACRLHAVFKPLARTFIVMGAIDSRAIFGFVSSLLCLFDTSWWALLGVSGPFAAGPVA